MKLARKAGRQRRQASLDLYGQADDLRHTAYPECIPEWTRSGGTSVPSKVNVLEGGPSAPCPNDSSKR
eukprot:COSAG06_NODE_32618_length_503_cov_0.762376_1_plen_67_part_10